jgi:hypothetical protein
MKYKTTSICSLMERIVTTPFSIIGILLLVVTSCSQTPTVKIDSRAKNLRMRLEGCNRLVVSEVYTAPDEAPIPPYTCTNQQAIAELVANLEFDDRNSGFHCMCSGDSLVTFYKGSNILATVSHHHGKSLRWDGWQGDSLFTAHTKEYWRMWFLKNGEPRYEEMHQQEVNRHNEDARINSLFLSAFPEGADKIFSSAGKATQFGLVKPKDPISKNSKNFFLIVKASPLLLPNASVILVKKAMVADHGALAPPGNNLFFN